MSERCKLRTKREIRPSPITRNSTLAGHNHDGHRACPRQSASHIQSHFCFSCFVTPLNAKSLLEQGLSVHRPIIYGNTACVLTPKEREGAPDTHTHRWTVAVRSAASSPDSDTVGGADDLGYFVKRVTFKLHDTYQNAVRSKSKNGPLALFRNFKNQIIVCDPLDIDKPPFEVSETGWGEFEVHIRISFIPEAGEKQVSLYHHLKLHPWMEGENSAPPPIEQALKLGPVHSWQYDEIVFNDPFQAFLNTLTAHPPTPLPRTSKRPVPYNPSNPASLEASRGGVPEFTQAMEKEEAERLEAAKKAVAVEQERLRLRLHEREKELERLKQQLGEV